MATLPFVSNYFDIGPTVFFFILVAMATRLLHGIEVFEQLERDHQRLVPVKFGEIPPSDKVEDVI